jgi:hypothetical protein
LNEENIKIAYVERIKMSISLKSLKSLEMNTGEKGRMGSRDKTIIRGDRGLKKWKK